MSEPYTPTTADVRGAASRGVGGDGFDRWLVEHDRQVAERAWNAGKRDNAPRADTGWGASAAIVWPNPENPYTRNLEEHK